MGVLNQGRQRNKGRDDRGTYGRNESDEKE